MAKRQRRRRQERRRQHAEMQGGQSRGLGLQRSVLTGAGVTAGALLGISAPALGAGITVSNADDPGNGYCNPDPTYYGCTLREAVELANSDEDFDYIIFHSSVTGTITLGAEIPITESIGIYGPGPQNLAVSGANATRIFNVNPDYGDFAGFFGLTLRDASVSGDGGAIRNEDSYWVVIDSILSGNDATGQGGAIYDRGAVYNGYFNLTGYSTFTDNTASLQGGAMYAYDNTGTIATSTFENNRALGTLPAGQGGGIWAFYGGSLYDSTVANNTATNYGGGLAESAGGFGVINTIVANNSAATNPDVSNYADGYFGLIEAQGAATIVGTQNIIGADPQLGALGDNGGDTPTMLPAATSPVVDRGFSGGGEDQRGIDTPVDNPNVANAPGGDGGDIGSVELTLAEGPQAPPPPPPPATTTTPFNLKKAIKRCKKKFRKGPKRKKCIRKAKRRAGLLVVHRADRPGDQYPMSPRDRIASRSKRGRDAWLGGGLPFETPGPVYSRGDRIR